MDPRNGATAYPLRPSEIDYEKLLDLPLESVGYDGAEDDLE